MISWVGSVEAEGRRERTDQVGFERRAAVSSDSFWGGWEEDSSCAGCKEPYARDLGMGNRCWARSVCRRDARQRRQIGPDMMKLSVSSDVRISTHVNRNPSFESSRIG